MGTDDISEGNARLDEYVRCSSGSDIRSADWTAQVGRWIVNDRFETQALQLSP